MKLIRNVIIVDDFYADPDAVIEHAHSLDYVYPYSAGASADQLVGWRTSRWRSSRNCPFKSSTSLIERLEFLTGESIDRRSWHEDLPMLPSGYPHPRVETSRRERGAWWHCCFHVKHGAGVTVHSHTDFDPWNPVGPDGWAGLIYLNRDAPRDAGLKTWKNMASQMPFDHLTAPESWRLIDQFGNIFNRLILHRGGIPHSGAPGWGRSLKDGRLFQTFFFRVSQPEVFAPISLGDLGLNQDEIHR